VAPSATFAASSSQRASEILLTNSIHHLDPRNVLAAAWQLFQVSLLKCVPFAVLAVAASAVPGAEAASASEPHGYWHNREWWGVAAASTALTLICYGSVLRVQLALLRANAEPIIVAMRNAALDVPRALLLIVMTLLPLVPAAAYLAWRGSGVVAALLTLLGCLPLVLASLSWPLAVILGLSPGKAYRRSVALVSANWSAILTILALTIAAILVFALLASIFMAVIINLAGPEAQTSAVGLGVSRWMMAAVLSLPIVFACAVVVTTCQTLLAAPSATSTLR
jgi:hypothetical protein